MVKKKTARVKVSAGADPKADSDEERMQSGGILS